jgi:hypothetical protein
VAHRNFREQLAALDSAAPGFAGVFFDDAGQLTVAVATDGFDAASVARVMEWVHEYSGPTRVVTRPNLRRVAHRYVELYGAYQSIRDHLWSGDNVVALGIEETSNKVVVGVRTATARASIAAKLPDWGVSADMVRFEQRDAALGETTLNQTFRPARGGLMINNQDNNPCTLGFNVYNWNTGIGGSSPLYFFTAGHCSGTWGQPPAQTIYYQPGNSPTGSRVGVEYATVPVHSGGYCPSGHSPCMDADVLVVQYDDTVSVHYGAVANVDASKNITGYFNVQGTTTGAFVGQVVTMVGQVSGKSTATVRQTCMDQLVSGPAGAYWILCQDSADYSSTGGDSGSPVFIPYTPGNPYTPAIVGIHSSVSTSTGHKWYTPISQIDFVFGGAYYYW